MNGEVDVDARRSAAEGALTSRTTQHPLELVEWPHQALLRKALAKSGIPRVLLVEPGTEPPGATGIDEGSIRSDASDEEIDACARRVLDRLRGGTEIVSIDRHTWSVSGYSFRLTPLQARLFAELAEHRGQLVTHERLHAVGWMGRSMTLDALQSAMQRLRDQLIGTGLRIRSIRTIGFLLV